MGGGPQAVHCPVFFGATNMDLLVPELGEKQAPAGVDKAARVGARLVVATHWAIQRTGRGSAQRSVIVRWIGGCHGDLRGNIAGIGEKPTQGGWRRKHGGECS